MSVFMFSNFTKVSARTGLDLLQENKLVVNRASQIAGFDFIDLVANNPDQKLYQGRYNQPLTFLLNALLLHKRLQSPHKVDCFIGHSMGELNALNAAGCISIEDALKFIRLSSDFPIFNQHSEDEVMTIVYGVTREHLQSLIQKHGFQTLRVGVENSLIQQVMGGKRLEIEEARKVFKQYPEITAFVELRRGFAFHCHPDEEYPDHEFTKIVGQLTLRHPTMPVYSSLHKKEFNSVDEIVRFLKVAALHPVEWRSTVEALLARGFTDFEEIGIGDTLTRIVIEIKKQVQQRDQL